MRNNALKKKNTFPFITFLSFAFEVSTMEDLTGLKNKIISKELQELRSGLISFVN